MSEKPLSEMTNEEILEQIKTLRTRRAAAQQRKKAGVSTPEERAERKKRGQEVTVVTGALGEALDDILFEDETPPEQKSLDETLDDLTQ